MINAADTTTTTHAAPVTAHGMRGGVELIDAVAPEWSALCAQPGNDEPFYRPEWIHAYLSAFEPSAEVVLVAARAADRLVGVLTLVSEVGTIGSMPARKLRAAGNTHTCRVALVLDRAFEAEVIEAMWNALLRVPGWDVLELENVPPGGALRRLVAHAAEEGYRTHALLALAPPYLDLTPLNGQFEALRLDAKFRSNLRRRRRKLESRGTVTLIASGEPGAVLEQFYALERAGWKGEAGSAIACDGATRAFYDAIARDASARGTLALYALELDGSAIAVHFGLHERERYYLLKTTYDERLRECSPGQLLTHDALRHLVTHGCREFDFLGGAMEWKSEWTPASRPLTDLYVFRGAAGRALHALRFRLRPALAAAVRRWRAPA